MSFTVSACLIASSGMVMEKASSSSKRICRALYESMAMSLRSDVCRVRSLAFSPTSAVITCMTFASIPERSIKTFYPIPTALGKLSKHQTVIIPAKSKGIGERDFDFPLFGHESGEVQRLIIRIRIFQIDRRRDDSVL